MQIENIESKIAEVIEASTADFVAQCYELYGLPPLGSLVKTRESATELYGVVYQAATASLEPGRRPLARGKEEASEEDIYRQNPQLAKVLRSEFRALVVGHKTGDRLYHYLPPAPARIHHFVYPCPKEEVREFGQSLAFLTLLINTHLPIPREELVAATLRQMSQAQEDPRRFLVAAGKELALLLGGELNSLKAILERIHD